MRSTLEEISLNGQGVELVRASSAEFSQTIPEIAEGQEALWVEDEVSVLSSVFRQQTALKTSEEKTGKKKKFNKLLFRNNSKKTNFDVNSDTKQKKLKKSIVLLPQGEEEGLKTLVDDRGVSEKKVVEDDGLENTERNLVRKPSEDVSSLGLKTDTFEYADNDSPPPEVVNVSSKIPEPEEKNTQHVSINENHEQDDSQMNKKTKWGILNNLRGKTKQIDSSFENDHTNPVTGSSAKPSSPKSISTEALLTDRYDIGIDSNNGDNEEFLTSIPENEETQKFNEGSSLGESDVVLNKDTEYMVRVQINSRGSREKNKDQSPSVRKNTETVAAPSSTSALLTEKEEDGTESVDRYRALHPNSPTVNTAPKMEREALLPSSEEEITWEIIDETVPRIVDENDIDQNKVMQEEENFSSGKIRTRIAGMFGNRKNKQKAAVKKVEEEMVTKDIENENFKDKGSPTTSSVKEESMTVIQEAMYHGNLKAQESNLEASESLKYRIKKSRSERAKKDVIDIIRARSYQYPERGRDPVDSTMTAIKKSQSQDPSGLSLSVEADTEKEIPKVNETNFLSLAPTPRKKVNKSNTFEGETSLVNRYQQEVTERLYGNATFDSATTSDKNSKSVYIGDLLPDMPDRVSTDQSDDTTTSNEDVEKQDNQGVEGTVAAESIAHMHEKPFLEVSSIMEG